MSAGPEKHEAEVTKSVDRGSDAQVVAQRARECSQAALPERIGRYHLKRVIASGGMGTVYEAMQESPRRVVAVKVMKHGIASKSALRRFEYEGQILGRLRHPGIAQIYEAGTHHDPAAPGVPVPFFAMEYIPNAKPITQFAQEKKLGTRERMALFAEVCDAVHHGHQKGIIHRDLKPSNILVDSAGQVKIIDFGVARSTDSDLAVTTLQTDVGQLIGTLQYMSPEQCDADPHDIDTRSDVYALGVVFYELLCEKPPYDLSRVAMHEATRIIRGQHPTKLSTLDRTLRGDTETIAFRALEKERERRYQSAAEFGQDIERYLSGEAILARRASIVYQLRLFARRNKVVFASLAAVFVVLLTGIIVSTSLYLRAERARQRAILAEQEQSRERDRAQQEAQTAKQVTDFLVGLFEVSDPSQALGNTITAREILDRGVKKIGDELKDHPVVRATLQDTMGRVYTSLGLYEPAEELLREATDIRRQELGSDDEQVAKSLTGLAWVLARQGMPAEAEPLYREALAIRRRLSVDDPANLALSLNNLANLLSDNGEFAAAEPLFREALAIRRELLGDEHADVALTLNNLGCFFDLKGDYEEAERLYREALAMSRKTLGEEHPQVAMILSNLGDVLATDARYDEAEQFYRQGLDMRRKLLGEGHPFVAGTSLGLANVVAEKGEFEEAERLYQRAEEIQRATLPPSHWAHQDRSSVLGSIRAAQGRFFDSEELLLESYRAWQIDPLTRAPIGPAKRDVVRRLVRLYDAWDNADPGKGYDVKAAEWRAKLDDLSVAAGTPQ